MKNRGCACVPWYPFIETGYDRGLCVKEFAAYMPLFTCSMQFDGASKPRGGGTVTPVKLQATSAHCGLPLTVASARSHRRYFPLFRRKSQARVYDRFTGHVGALSGKRKRQGATAVVGSRLMKCPWQSERKTPLPIPQFLNIDTYHANRSQN